MPNNTESAAGPLTVEAGYQILSERAAEAITRLTAISVTGDAVILSDDQFFHPIYRTLSQDVAQCVASALDHLRFLAWSLQSRERPFPYAQATLIRTATTGASTALWMVSGSTPLERRSRAMEFMFNDLKSQLSWMNTTATEPMNQQRPAAEIAEFDVLRQETERRIDWVVQQANMLLSPSRPYTRRTYGQSTTTDTDMVRSAGVIATALGAGGWDSGTVLLNSWQVLSGYAHARPWALSLGGNLTIVDPEPNQANGTIRISPAGKPDQLLDFAFRAVIVAETAVGWLEQLAS